MEICGAIYNRPDTIGELGPLPDPIRCNLPPDHSGSHSYSDNYGGVSWDDDTLNLTRKELETIGERMARDIDFPSVLEYNRLQKAKRRERIATQVLAAAIGHDRRYSESRFYDFQVFAADAVAAADALIAKLDKGK